MAVTKSGKKPQASTVETLVNDWRIGPGQDCCRFANYLVEGLHGLTFLPEYDDEDAFLAHFDNDLEAAVSTFVPNPTSADSLNRGDLCLITVMDQQSIGVVIDDGHAVCLFRDGMPRYISRAFVDSGWKLT